MQAPLTLSVARTLLVEIAGEPYAFPLAHVTRTLKVAKDRIEALEGRQHFRMDDQQVGLISAHQILGRGEPKFADELCVVVIGGKTIVMALSLMPSWENASSWSNRWMHASERLKT